MKTNIILVLLVVFCISGVFLMYNKLSALEYRYETLKESNIRLQLKEPLTSNQIKEREFKEEMYIRQQEKDTTLILSIFGAFSILVGFFTFRSVREEFVNKVNQIDQSNIAAKAEIQNKYIEITHSYRKLENEYNLYMTEEFIRKASTFLNVNSCMYVFYKLKSIKSIINALENTLNESPYLQQSLLKRMNEQVLSAINMQKHISQYNLERDFVSLEHIDEAQELISFITQYLMNNDWELYKDFSKTICDLRFENKE